MPLKEHSEQTTFFKDDTLVITQKLLLNERADGKLHAQRITAVNGTDVGNNQVVFSPFESGKSMDEAMKDIRARWEETERGELEFVCRNAVLYGRVKQIEPNTEYMGALLKGALVHYYTLPDMMAVESPGYESSDRYAISTQFQGFRMAAIWHQEEKEDADSGARSATDRYENAYFRLAGAAQNISDFINAEIWGDPIRPPGAGHEDSPYEYALQGGEKKDTFEEYRDPGEPPNADMVPLEGDGMEMGDDFYPSNDEQEHANDNDNEYGVPELEGWEEGEQHDQHDSGGYEVGEQTPMMRLIPEVTDRMFELCEQLTKAWVMTAMKIQKGESLGDEQRSSMVESLNEAIGQVRDVAAEFSDALTAEGKREHVPRFEQLMQAGWRNHDNVEVKGLLAVAETMRDMVKTKRADLYVQQGREGPTPGVGELPPH